MTLVATDKHLAVLVSDLSATFKFFSNEAARLNVLLARLEAPLSRKSCHELQRQCTVEVQAFEEYLNRKEEIFAYLSLESRHA